MRLAILIAAMLVPAAVSAQLRVPPMVQRVLPGGRQKAPVLVGIDALRADFVARSGSDTIYFGTNSAVLGPPARAVLAAQAAWLRRQPAVVVRVEGHGDANDARDHALGIGARRAQEVRDYLVLLGVPAAQISTTSWGKAKPGAGRAVTILVR